MFPFLKSSWLEIDHKSKTSLISLDYYFRLPTVILTGKQQQGYRYIFLTPFSPLYKTTVKNKSL